MFSIFFRSTQTVVVCDMWNGTSSLLRLWLVSDGGDCVSTKRKASKELIKWAKWLHDYRLCTCGLFQAHQSGDLWAVWYLIIQYSFLCVLLTTWRSFDKDLYRLAVYLRMEPFVQSNSCWNELISGDQSGLHLLFAHLMRRKTKVEVNDQLQLPDLTYDIQWLSFPPVEGYFYNATFAASQTLFLQTIHKKNMWVRSLS